MCRLQVVYGVRKRTRTERPENGAAILEDTGGGQRRGAQRRAAIDGHMAVELGTLSPDQPLPDGGTNLLPRTTHGGDAENRETENRHDR